MMTTYENHGIRPLGKGSERDSCVGEAENDAASFAETSYVATWDRCCGPLAVEIYGSYTFVPANLYSASHSTTSFLHDSANLGPWLRMYKDVSLRKTRG